MPFEIVRPGDFLPGKKPKSCSRNSSRRTTCRSSGEPKGFQLADRYERAMRSAGFLRLCPRSTQQAVK